MTESIPHYTADSAAYPPPVDQKKRNAFPVICNHDYLKLKSQIKEDWSGELADTCLLILIDLLLGGWDLDHISFADLCFYAKDSRFVLKLLPYMTGERTHLLDLKFYFLDGNNVRHNLNDDQARAANAGEIKHPVTNEILDYVEASKQVFMYFTASDLIKKIRNDYE